MADRLIIEVNLTSGDTKSVFNEAERRGKKAAKSIGDQFRDKIGGGLKTAFAGFLGFQAVTRSLRFLTDQVDQSIQSLREFTRSVGNVNSILPRNDRLLKNSTDTFRAFASQFSTTSARQADAFYSIVSAGVKTTARQLETLEIANEAAIAGLVDIDQATKLLVSSVNAYAGAGLTAKKASDTLFAAVREGQTTFQELSNFLGNTTSIAFSAGATFEDLAGTLAFVTKAGIQTDRAVIGLRQLFTSLIKITKQASDEANRIGLEFNTAALRAKGLAGFLKDVAEKTGGSAESLGKLFGNVRALNPVLAVVNGQFDDYQRILKETNTSQDDTAEAADQIRKSLDFKLDNLTSAFRILGEELVSVLEPVLGRVAVKLTEFIKLLLDSTPRLEKMKIRVADLRKELSDLESSGNPFESLAIGLKRIEGNAGGTIAEIERLRKTISKLDNQIAQEELEKNLQRSELARLTRARGQLELLNKELEKAKEAKTFVELSKGAKDLDDSVTKSIDGLTGIDLDIRIGRDQEKIMQEIEKTKATIKFLENELTIKPEIKIDSEKFKDAIDNELVMLRKAQGEYDKYVGNIQKLLVNGLQKTTIQVFSRIGAQLVQGASAWDGFQSAILNIVGDLAINLGTAIVFMGKAIDDLAKSLASTLGGFAIAGGLALIAFGGALKATASSAMQDAASGGGGGGGGQSFGGGNASELPDPEDLERILGSEINITVEGSLVQQEELGAFISDVISESNEKNGNVIVNPSFA